MYGDTFDIVQSLVGHNNTLPIIVHVEIIL